MKFELPKKEIGNIIRTKRVKQGLSQGKLAKKLQCNTQLISNIERGVCTPKNELFKEISLN
jgi:ribosome-binding protein aMBF1 (putative translation factor)